MIFGWVKKSSGRSYRKKDRNEFLKIESSIDLKIIWKFWVCSSIDGSLSRMPDLLKHSETSN